MVPFYGQGMNAGFEDVRILFKYIQNPEFANLTEALDAYSRERRKDAHSINDLAMRNYIEMRADVTSRMYKFRKQVEEFLYDNAPCLGFRTQYNMVSFSNIRYSNVIKAVQRQKTVLNSVFAGVGIVSILSAYLFGRRAGWIPAAVGGISAEVWKAAVQGVQRLAESV